MVAGEWMAQWLTMSDLTAKIEDEIILTKFRG